MSAKQQVRIVRADADRHAPAMRGRFANPNGVSRPSNLAVLRWSFGVGQRDQLGPQLDRVPIAADVPDLQRCATLSYLGHATVAMRLSAGQMIITDPVFDSPPGFRRHIPPVVSFEALPPCDAVLISHNHYDHLEKVTVRRFPSEQLFVVPSGLAGWFARQGRKNVVELDWWDHIEFGGLEICMVPAQHWSRRRLLDENRSLWGGYVVCDGQHQIYFAGDSGWFDGFATIGAAFDLDVALLPIGAHAPRWFMANQHIDPQQALDALVALGAKQMLPIHWGVFTLAEEPLTEPPALLAQLMRERRLESRVTIWPIGGEYRLPC